MLKLYFFKCAHFLLFLSLSTFFIYHFHSYTKILTLISLFSTPNFPCSHPDSPHLVPYSAHSHPYSLYSLPDSPHAHHSHLDSLHSHPDFPHSHHSPHSVPRFPIPTFTDSPSVLLISFSRSLSAVGMVLEKLISMFLTLSIVLTRWTDSQLPCLLLDH